MPPRIGPKRPIRVFLAEWRDHAGISQEQLGNRINPPVDKGTVSRWEAAARAGKIGVPIVAAFAEAIGRNHQDMMRHPDAPAPLDSIALELGVLRDDAVTALEIIARRKAS